MTRELIFPLDSNRRSDQWAWNEKTSPFRIEAVIISPLYNGRLTIRSGDQKPVITQLEPQTPVKVFVGPGDSVRACHQIQAFDGRVLEPEVLVTIPQGNPPTRAIIAHNTGLDELRLHAPEDWVSGVTGVVAYYRSAGDQVEILDR